MVVDVNQTDDRVIIVPRNAIPPGKFKRNEFPEEEERPPPFPFLEFPVFFQRICIGVSAPPCLCSDKCEVRTLKLLMSLCETECM